MTTKAPERRLNWAHSVMNDPGSSQKDRRAAETIISKHDPDFWEDERESALFGGER